MEKNPEKQVKKAQKQPWSTKKKVIVGVVAFFIIVAIAQGAAKKSDTSTNNNSAVKTGETSKSEAPKEEKTEFKVGDVISFDGKEVVVKSLQRNYLPANEYSRPKAGKEFVKAQVEIQNKSNDELSYNILDWSAEDADGSIESATFSAFGEDDLLGSGNLAKGGKKSGSVIFEVPAGQKIKIHYKSSFWSNKKIVIDE